MVNYEKISEAELDQYLAVSYLPLRKEKINFWDKHNFISLLVSKLRTFDLLDEFGENIIFFAASEAKKEKRILWQGENLMAVEIFCLDMKQIKMAALKTYHENSEFIKL